MNLSRHVFGVCMLAFAAGLGGLGNSAFAADRGLSVSAGADRANTRSIYSALGFDGPLRELADAGRLRAGWHAALTRLLRETGPGDRVFVYVSGRGVGSAPRRCELLAAAHTLGRRAAQVVMVVDAPGGGTCAAGPARLATQGRVVVLSATRRGASVTQALRGCLAQPGFTANPLATFGDLVDCTRAAERTPGRPPVMVAGNDELPLQPRLTALVAPSAAVATETPLAALQRVAATADSQWHVRVAEGGGGVPAWSVTSDHDGFVYVVRAAADGSGVSLVYPQHPDEPNVLRAGQDFQLPRAGLGEMRASPGLLMVVVGDTALRSGDLLVKLGLSHYAAAACLRKLGSDDCPSTAAGPAGAPATLRFGAAALH
jgi:hypothetical protein